MPGPLFQIELLNRMRVRPEFESNCNLRSVGGRVSKSGNKRPENGSSVEVGTGVGGICVGVGAAVGFGV